MGKPDIIQENVPLGPLTTLKVGGPARYFAACKDEAALVAVLRWAARQALSVFVLGGGSNVLIDDAGFDGIVIQCAMSSVRFQTHDGHTVVNADAGVNWDSLVERCVNAKLAGIECLSGIPGMVGAAPVQNIGAYGQEVVDTIVSVTGIDASTYERHCLSAAECRFNYRTSVFKTDWRTFIVTGVAFKLTHADAGSVTYPDLKQQLNIAASSSAPTLAETRRAVLTIRAKKSMVLSDDDPNRRSVGSFFVNPVISQDDFEQLSLTVRKLGIDRDIPSFPMDEHTVKVPAAWLIEQAGFERGHTEGSVGISTKHSLAIINQGDANAKDILRFAAQIKMTVLAKFGIDLVPEPVLLVGTELGQRATVTYSE
ncbi:MAG: UDP-N-acetylmuramate dehydrogenase [Pseudomonadota bacterium]